MAMPPVAGHALVDGNDAIYQRRPMIIRCARETDLNVIREVIETAFSDEENKVIMELVADLSGETTHPPITSLVAEAENQIVGYVSYSPIFLRTDPSMVGYILAPLAVAPKHQKKGVGAKLIKNGIDRLTRDGADCLLVYGDPTYYSRFGFREEIGRPFVPPYPLQYPFGWAGMILSGAYLPEEPTPFACVSALSKPDLW